MGNVSCCCGTTQEASPHLLQATTINSYGQERWGLRLGAGGSATGPAEPGSLTLIPGCTYCPISFY